ncbi:MAG: isoleucine--tRNA ligase [Legionellaceae bacterium]|nr:isoleucine--tRNA ligase [Legionellaceae bacterium]
MTEYKNTLNLPKTLFPMKAGLAKREPEMLARWQENNTYGKLREARSGCERFILHDGPPYANGHLHCGHALNKILKDFIVKSKSLSGFDAPFVPGWDCHGLPIELNVEKKVGKAGVKVTPAEFRQKCRDYATTQIKIQKDEFQRLGVFGDWQNPYVTMDYKYEANITRSLAKMMSNGHMTQGFKPVHWCIDCGSSLAEAEVDYEDKQSQSIDVGFEVVDCAGFLANMGLCNSPQKKIIVPIWTTTPWTLPANEAVSLNAELEYSLLFANDSYILVADDLISSVMERYNISEFKVIGKALGEVFELLQLKHPLFENVVVPIILGDHVTTDAGTGCVHTAPAHGVEDFHVGEKYKLALKNPVLGNGCYTSEVPLFSGLSVLKANVPILERLSERGLLLSSEKITHSYPHCWRHKTPTIFRATPQWFISMDKHDLRGQILKTTGNVKWVPDWGKARIEKMISGRPDWCISRQRSWGSPIPLFLHKITKQPHPDSISLMEQIALKIEKSGIEAWFELDPKELLMDEANDYEKSTDTLDVWFDSGVSHYCVLGPQGKNLGFPADVYFEGSDQHRGWFNSSLTTSVAMYEKAPYKTVLTHGYTVDSEGKKLSKSKGNYVALDKLIGQYGADILRLWVSSSDYRNELSISDEIIKRNADGYRRLRNTARFLLANLFDFDKDQDCLEEDDLLDLDSWIIYKCKLLQEEIVNAYENYQFHTIYQKIHHFCAIDLGSFYLDIIKDRQYTTAVNSRARRSCQTAMYHIIHALTRWLAPIISFTADEIWQYIPGNNTESVFLEQWYQEWPKLKTIDMNYWHEIQKVRNEVNKAIESTRQAGEVGSGLAADITIYADDKLKPLLEELGDELRFVFITSKVKVLSYANRSENAVNIEELGLAIEVVASTSEKCARCWHRLDNVGENHEHPELCLRCVDNINGNDEMRLYA